MLLVKTELPEWFDFDNITVREQVCDLVAINLSDEYTIDISTVERLKIFTIHQRWEFVVLLFIQDSVYAKVSLRDSSVQVGDVVGATPVSGVDLLSYCVLTSSRGRRCISGRGKLASMGTDELAPV